MLPFEIFNVAYLIIVFNINLNINSLQGYKIIEKNAITIVVVVYTSLSEN